MWNCMLPCLFSFHLHWLLPSLFVKKVWFLLSSFFYYFPSFIPVISVFINFFSLSFYLISSFLPTYLLSASLHWVYLKRETRFCSGKLITNTYLKEKYASPKYITWHFSSQLYTFIVLSSCFSQIVNYLGSSLGCDLTVKSQIFQQGLWLEVGIASC